MSATAAPNPNATMGGTNTRLTDIQDSASMLEALGDNTVGRGVIKSNMTPAQR